jgi:hypothetical protein
VREWWKPVESKEIRMATRFMYKALATTTLGIALSLLLRGTTSPSSAASSTVAQLGSDQISTVFDPVGDTIFDFNAPFQDFVRAQMTRTESGDYEMLMEMAEAVPASPGARPGARELWWFWIFDLDPTTHPAGYPWQNAGGRPPEFIVCVSWNGTEFAGTAIDRRPLLTGEEAIITSVPFSINGRIVEAVLSSELIGSVPTFRWGPFTFDWSGPVASEGVQFADYAFELGTITHP